MFYIVLLTFFRRNTLVAYIQTYDTTIDKCWILPSHFLCLYIYQIFFSYHQTAGLIISYHHTTHLLSIIIYYIHSNSNYFKCRTRATLQNYVADIVDNNFLFIWVVLTNWQGYFLNPFHFSYRETLKRTCLSNCRTDVHQFLLPSTPQESVLSHLH